MTNHIKAVLVAFLAAVFVNLFGVLFFFAPIAASDKTAAPLVPTAVGFFIYVISIVALFDWTARQMQSTVRAAFVIGASQFLLVNVDFVLSGKRGLLTAGASTALMIATWVCIAFAYSRFHVFGRNGGRE
jgi:ABC-type maltose transport system permease subunit